MVRTPRRALLQPTVMNIGMCGRVVTVAIAVWAVFGTGAARAQAEQEVSMAENADPVAAIEAFIKEKGIDATRSGWRTSLPKPPKVTFDPAKSYFWVLETNQGKIKFKLLPAVAPMHVSSTIYLTKLGFYDGLAFHRVISGFMAQGGCPLGTGTGSPGYRFDGEFDRSVRHDKPGVLSMANAGPGTDGSQFFITFTATPHLDGKHTVFGNVVEGADVIRALEQRGSPSGRPSEKLEISKATITVE
jgi:peptidyl-prolyl cis-trans isomerase B (cyclophilin B)